MERPRILKRKPLVEALLEVRWALEGGPAPDLARDPHYQFLLGKLFENIKGDFPHHEQLPVAVMPADMTPYTPHHRFRVAPNGWPLLQIGPGVLTVNDTVDYSWERFEQQITRAVPALVASHPQPSALRFETLMLRYINAVLADPSQVNVLELLSRSMKIQFSVPDSIFADGNIGPAPVRLATEFVFPCREPSGLLTLKFATGRKDKQPALIFELWFVSRGKQVPVMPEGFGNWASGAHAVIEEIFFRLIEGDLLKEFTGDVPD